jgi:hypothetical protein
MFDFLKNPLIKSLIRRGIGSALALGSAWLVKKGLASAPEAAKLAEDLVEPLAVIAFLAYDLARTKGAAKAEAKIAELQARQ